MTMITPSYLGETIEYSSLHACRSTLEDPNTQYALSYRRAGSDTLGYHRIKVEVVGQRGLTAHYRAGYYLFQP